MLYRRTTLRYAAALLVGFTTCAEASFYPQKYPTDNPLEVSLNGNFWDELRDNLQLDEHADQPDVQAQVNWYCANPYNLKGLAKQSAPYIYYVYQQTKKRNLPPELALIPIVESQYNPFAFSHVGATGLWQIMPGTASGLGLNINWWYDGRRDVTASTDAALKHLTYLHKYFGQDWLLAMAAYDSGEGTVKKAIQENRMHGKPTDFWHLKLPRETRSYVPKLLALVNIIDHPDRCSVDLPAINNAPYLTEVRTGSQIDLTQAAQLANMDVDKLRKFNPGFRRWATDPEGKHSLLLPINKAKNFMRKIASLPKSKRMIWEHHVVEKGDFLFKIAHKYQTTVNVIRLANALKKDTLKLGQSLLVPRDYRGPIDKKIVKQRATVAADNLPGPQRLVHHVVAGEKIEEVAKRYGVKANQLSYWNKLSYKPRLKPKQKLVIWSKTVKHKPVNQIYTYTVKSGDNLSTLAVRFNTTVKAIKQASDLKNSSIREKQKIQIPANTRSA